MTDKYGLADKFAAIALQLDPEGADADLETLESLKSIRDAIVHRGDNKNPRELPLESAREYLRLHVAEGQAES
jgi:hypothetical protein